MNKVKVKMFPENGGGLFSKGPKEIEKEINEFISENDIEIVDLKMAANRFGVTITLLYKEIK